MVDLLPGTVYYYRVGGDKDAFSTWSETKSFRTLTPDQEVKVAVVADMGYADNSDNTVKCLIDLTEANELDVLLHSGDIGYADGFEPHWDTFFNKIEPIASRIPLMV